jgi:hypothetical protein
VTPAERVVVEAAVRLETGQADYPPLGEAVRLETGQADYPPLGEAVRALLAERADPATPREISTTWDQVVEGDEIYSPKTRKWYPVTEAGALAASGRRKVVAKGLPQPIRPMGVHDVLIRRGATGQAVDMFASVLWSMPTLPSLPAASLNQAPAEVPDVAQDPEASEPDA